MNTNVSTCHSLTHSKITTNKSYTK
jgi:hypothetical protein